MPTITTAEKFWCMYVNIKCPRLYVYASSSSPAEPDALHLLGAKMCNRLWAVPDDYKLHFWSALPATRQFSRYMQTERLKHDLVRVLHDNAPSKTSRVMGQSSWTLAGIYHSPLKIAQHRPYSLELKSTNYTNFLLLMKATEKHLLDAKGHLSQ